MGQIKITTEMINVHAKRGLDNDFTTQIDVNTTSQEISNCKQVLLIYCNKSTNNINLIFYTLLYFTMYI